MTVLESPPLTVRPYYIEDGRFVSAWRFARGDEDDIHLPPHGVVVEDEAGPCAALWIAEPAGFGCAYLEYPISRPGLPLIQACSAFRLAVETLIETAGKRHEPPGDYHSFRAVTPAPLARMLMRMGFEQEVKEPMVAMIYRKP